MGDQELTQAEVCEKFFWYVRNNYRTQHAAALHFKVSDQAITYACKGDRPPNKDMLKAMGYKKVKTPPTFVRVKK